jgi:predicted RNA-binding protein associated with RNAse of E/G family
MGVTLRRGDRFVETYYSNRGYNIFEIYDREDGALKGYYCNVTRPARFADGRVEYEDLFLDLWVGADGAQTILDEDEFLAADLDEAARRAARDALKELQLLFESKMLPP